MESLQKLHKIISDHSDDFSTEELLEILECLGGIAVSLQE